MHISKLSYYAICGVGLEDYDTCVPDRAGCRPQLINCPQEQIHTIVCLGNLDQLFVYAMGGVAHEETALLELPVPENLKQSARRRSRYLF